MKRLLLAATLMALTAGCDRQRDLYVHSAQLLRVESDWQPSLGLADMTGRATAVLYDAKGLSTTEFFNTPRYVEMEVSRGEQGVLVFNGLMFSETDTNLEHIYFRNTARAETFEAVAEEAEPNRRLSRAEDEYIASNDMEILTSAWAEVSIDGGYARIYRNGHLQYVDFDAYDDQRVEVIPEPVSYYAQVIIHLTNPASAQVADGALRGFAGSAFMASGRPSRMRATHQLKFSTLRLDPVADGAPKTGTIESPLFVTFGPPTDLPDDDTAWNYEFELDIVLQNGEIMNRTFDVRNQVLPVIEKIRNGRLENSAALPIVIEIGLDLEQGIVLPIIDQSVGVNPWEDDEIIHVPITQ